ncbi:MAG: hypothetical protein V5A47_11000 [Bacteroidales bacterium]
MNENVMPFEVIDDKHAVVFSESAADLFEEDVDVEPFNVKGNKKCVPWGQDNLQPVEVLGKIGKNEVMNSNMLFNIQTGYGAGFQIQNKDGSEITDENVTKFTEENNLDLYFLEQFTDLQHFYFTVAEIILSGDKSKIVELNHLESYYVRFEEANKKTGKIENVFYANWEDSEFSRDPEVIPLLDQRNPLKDLRKRVAESKSPKKFAILMKIPIPGRKYYPDPYYYSAFRSGWYDVSAMTATAKKMAMQYGIKVRFMVRIHPDYWQKIFDEENITDPDKQIERKRNEYVNIKNFLTSYENEGKTWFNGFYVDPTTGKEVPHVQIEKVDYDKGGDFIQDAEEASNMICYAQGIHPNLIGATPGKSKGSFSGTDKRELFTMKQSLQRPFKNLLMTPVKVVKGFNQWPKEVTFDIPMLLLTTLDQGTDAKKVNQENAALKNEIDQNANNDN